MITTPEQMREAAVAKLQYLQDVSGRNQDGDFYVGEEAACFAASVIDDAVNAIRAIPIAPHPVAVTVKPLVDRFNVRLDVEGNTATAMMEQCQNGYWVRIYDYEALSALTIHPADPLSDPRVVALVEALKREPTLIWIIENTTQVRIRDLAMDMLEQQRAALRAIGGEA